MLNKERNGIKDNQQTSACQLSKLHTASWKSPGACLKYSSTLSPTNRILLFPTTSLLACLCMSALGKVDSKAFKGFVIISGGRLLSFGIVLDYLKVISLLHIISFLCFCFYFNICQTEIINGKVNMRAKTTYVQITEWLV